MGGSAMNAPGIDLHLSAGIGIGGYLWPARLNGCGRVLCQPGWHRGPDWAARLRDFDLWFVWSGRGSVLTNDAEIILAPGVCLWMRPGRSYEATQGPASRLGISFFHFDLLNPRRRSPLPGIIPPFEAFRSQRFDFLDTALRRVIELREDVGGAPAAERLFGAVLAGLVHEHGAAGRAKATGVEQHHREVILGVAAKIREDPGSAGSMARLARATGYSVDHFSRTFARITGRRPRDYVIAAKIERARQLLAESSLNVGMIAEMLGYRSLFFFSRQFLQRTGQTPTAYRRGIGASSVSGSAGRGH
jgi:AraC-like DNA-binding protein